MTDVQVSKLSRRDLLEILLAVETDNNALQQELSELREQLQQLKQDLSVQKAITVLVDNAKEA